MRSTYTYATMEVSPGAFIEIRKHLEEAGYQQAIHLDGGHTFLDMRGIALASGPGKPWHLTGKHYFSIWDRIRILFGVPVVVRFFSPSGHCSAACDLQWSVQRDWPADPGPTR